VLCKLISQQLGRGQVLPYRTGWRLATRAPTVWCGDPDRRPLGLALDQHVGILEVPGEGYQLVTGAWTAWTGKTEGTSATRNVLVSHRVVDGGRLFGQQSQLLSGLQKLCHLGKAAGSWGTGGSARGI
jgi:hypothetical protein